MRVRSYGGAEDFWAAAGPLLVADPSANTVVFTVVDRLRHGLPYSDCAPILLTVHESDEHSGWERLIGAAVCTPPFPMVLNALPERALPTVVSYLFDTGERLSGLSGRRELVESFATLWTDKVGGDVHTMRDERLYRLDRLLPPGDVPGSSRLATDADVALLAGWRAAFSAEALHTTESDGDFALMARNSITVGAGNVLWQVDGSPVALAVASRPQHGMSRIGPVYTPPDRRGRGYGSAVTAAATRWALDQGTEHMLLFTDLANPTSNSIYQKIGYRPVFDQVVVEFVSPG
jgi:GNAT superfamily N-acetyltransferase